MDLEPKILKIGQFLAELWRNRWRRVKLR